MNVTAIPPQIIKEAEMLRNRLDKGLINILELSQFLQKVERYAPPPTGNRKRMNKTERMATALNRLK